MRGTVIESVSVFFGAQLNCSGHRNAVKMLSGNTSDRKRRLKADGTHRIDVHEENDGSYRGH